MSENSSNSNNVVNTTNENTSTAATTTSSSSSSSLSSLPESIILSHTRAWRGEKRKLFQSYAEFKEDTNITQILNENNIDLFSSELLPSCPPSSLPPSITSNLTSIISSSLSTIPKAGSLEARGKVLQMGDQAIVDFGRGRAWLNMDGQSTRILKVARSNVKQLPSLCGTPYGSVWELDGKGNGGKLKRTNRVSGIETELRDAESGLIDAGIKSNKELYDTNNSQTLSAEQIIALKKDVDTTPQQFINAIVDGSSTFANKTAFSQEKYIAKKKQKHALELSVLPATLNYLLDTMWNKDPRKMRGLRPDTVAIALSIADVQPGRRILVVDGVSGAFLAACAYRTGGLATIISAEENNGDRRTEAVKRCNFPKNISRSIKHIKLEKLMEEVENIGIKQENTQTNMETEENNANKSVPAAAATTTTTPAISPSPASSSDPSSLDPPLTPSYLLSHPVDCLIIASRYDPYSLLMSLWSYLSPSGRFVIYDETSETLAATHAKLSTGQAVPVGNNNNTTGGELAINVQLSEAFFRNYQVLPNRTHPFVNMSASGGYLLSGHKMK